MIQFDLQILYPHIMDWIHQTVASYLPQAKTIASSGFGRLPLYFEQNLLVSAKFVIVDRVPVPPLSRMGLSQFTAFEQGDYDGITYLDTFFIKRYRAGDEQLHFHELIHVLQWRLLGPERFLAVYADGLETFGYRKSPLEIMAYDAENKFVTVVQPFDARKLVEEQLNRVVKI